MVITQETTDNVKLKAWALDAAEPAEWTLTATESALTTGLACSPGATNDPSRIRRGVQRPRK